MLVIAKRILYRALSELAGSYCRICSGVNEQKQSVERKGRSLNIRYPSPTLHPVLWSTLASIIYKSNEVQSGILNELKCFIWTKYLNYISKKGFVPAWPQQTLRFYLPIRIYGEIRGSQIDPHTPQRIKISSICKPSLRVNCRETACWAFRVEIEVWSRLTLHNQNGHPYSAISVLGYHLQQWL